MGNKASSLWPSGVSEEFNSESDRALVILASALLDQALKGALKAHLVKSPTKGDNLFDGPNAPMGNFSSRIDFSYRLGLISHKMCRNLHIIKKIRNEFAHNITGCTFENQAVKDRIFQLRKSLPLFFNDPKLKSMLDADRRALQMAVGVIALYLHNLANEIVPIDQQSSEWFYKVPVQKKDD